MMSLAIRWILEAAFKRRISYRISLEKCSFAEILDAYRKRGIALALKKDIEMNHIFYYLSLVFGSIAVFLSK
jgi:ribosomal protein S7